ncbi:MAG: fasciclin domain-containing protein [Planctomycetes bacterium]|nr:fasciclin domain-containing protein [Planctomycetota bacterium]
MNGFAKVLACSAAVAFALALPGGAVFADCGGCKAVTQGSCPSSGAGNTGAVTGGGGTEGGNGHCGKAAAAEAAASSASPACCEGAGKVAESGGGCAAQEAACSGCPFAKATAQGAGTFNTLIAAVKAAGLWETLTGPGPFTVFAPTDEAFAKLPAGTVEALVKDVPRLQAILKYHVVKGRVTGEILGHFTSATAATLQGQALSIKVCPKSGVHVNDAKVTKADIPAPNGVVHVIDRVLLPETEVAAAER